MDEFFSMLKRIGEHGKRPVPFLPASYKESLPDKDALIETQEATGEVLQDAVGTGWYIAYKDSSGSSSRRRISVNRITVINENLYLNAYCHSRQAPRQFKVANISEAVDLATGEVLDTSAIISNRFTALLKLLHSDPRINSNDALKACRHGLNILAFLSRCDGHMHPAEEDVMIRWIDDAFFYFELDQTVLLNHIRRLYPTNETYLESIQKFYNFRSNKSAEKFRDYAMRLIEADGVIVAEEARSAAILPDKKPLTPAKKNVAAEQGRNPYLFFDKDFFPPLSMIICLSDGGNFQLMLSSLREFESWDKVPTIRAHGYATRINVSQKKSHSGLKTFYCTPIDVSLKNGNTYVNKIEYKAGIYCDFFDLLKNRLKRDFSD